MRFSTIVIAATAAICLPHAANATQPSASGNAAVSSRTSVAGNFVLGANGTATSFSQNSQSASTKLSTATSYTPNYNTVNAAVSGITTTDSSGKAYNLSTGSGTGSAISGGMAATKVQGNVGIHGVTNGTNGGGSETQTHSLIKAGTNQGSYFVGQTKSGFDAQVNFSRVGGNNVSSQTTGYASGANSAHALEGMNAAGVANIGATGRYFAGTGMSSFAP